MLDGGSLSCASVHNMYFRVWQDACLLGALIRHPGAMPVQGRRPEATTPGRRAGRRGGSDSRAGHADYKGALSWPCRSQRCVKPRHADYKGALSLAEGTRSAWMHALLPQPAMIAAAVLIPSRAALQQEQRPRSAWPSSPAVRGRSCARCAQPAARRAEESLRGVRSGRGCGRWRASSRRGARTLRCTSWPSPPTRAPRGTSIYIYIYYVI
jgi:hypothetical protein